MSFDSEIDELKKEMASRHLDPEAMIIATQELRDTLEEKLASDRLSFVYEMDDEEGPSVKIEYKGGHFQIGTCWIQPDGSVVFGSESEYFPPVLASDDKEAFLKEAREFLKEGLAMFELDEEAEEDYEV